MSRKVSKPVQTNQIESQLQRVNLNQPPIKEKKSQAKKAIEEAAIYENSKANNDSKCDTNDYEGSKASRKDMGIVEDMKAVEDLNRWGGDDDDDDDF
mmetsp:Transcript_21372/g.20672  ORF Transcript_21372/g.20672 Transcript_21372/m.20672 type:complete len:97 (-) Transcript_21372:167-457(-)|eukprot:CAMPEP_0119047280 /NCGR_PEP_ID=MMETSP1177-20130426/52208_1 /TAXON_ID=2985 /ORGANISM="Ochromonas sp, Strain CCMP1899" /LENGTH=96 /DNA_ID=CAMNT_0007021657 /DNA_START=153 /DNA_END=443 /DNA_ORIENTATION=+